MPKKVKKRKGPESRTDQQTKGGSDSFQVVDNYKCAKLARVQDLPPELIEDILLTAIVMEVKEMKLAKSVWNEKAQLAIGRLSNVCSLWCDILATNTFRNALHRTLASIGSRRFDILHQALLPIFTVLYDWSLATIEDEIFMMPFDLNRYLGAIHVFDRNNVEVVKEVIRIPVGIPQCLIACGVRNCLYLLNREEIYNHFTVLRISRDDPNSPTISQVIGDKYLPNAGFCVSANGSLVLSRQQTKRIDAISVYDANGDLQRTIRLPSFVPKFSRIVPKANGNIVLVDAKTLTEIDTNGGVVRKFESHVFPFKSVCNADNVGTMLVTSGYKTEFLDSEFNLLDLSSTQQIDSEIYSMHDFCFNRARNYVVAISTKASNNQRRHFLSIFRLTS